MITLLNLFSIGGRGGGMVNKIYFEEVINQHQWSGWSLTVNSSNADLIFS